MSRHSSSGAYGHRVRCVGKDWYKIGWTVDFHYPTSRLRFPRSFDRDTDEAGARRFIKKWKVPDYRIPAELKEESKA